MSSQEGHEGVVKLLLAKDADVDQANNNGATPLSSSQSGHKAVVKLLLAHGADANHANNDGATPLSASSQNGNQEVMKMLMAGTFLCNLSRLYKQKSATKGWSGCSPT